VGDPAQAEARCLPLRRLATPLADLVQRLPYVELQRMLDPSAPAGLRQYGLGVNLLVLGEGAIATLAERAAARPTPLSQIHVHQLGGAVVRVAEEATAHAGRDASYVVNIIATWTDPGDDERARDWARETRRRLAAFAAPRTYLNFLGEAEQTACARLRLSQHDRLRELKRRWDPTNLFRSTPIFRRRTDRGLALLAFRASRRGLRPRARSGVAFAENGDGPSSNASTSCSNAAQGG
jgi:hypothetical protein